MERSPREVRLDVAAGASQTTQDVDISLYSLFSVYTPSFHASTTHLQVLDVPYDGGTANDVDDDVDNLLIVPVKAAKSAVLPAEVAALHRIKLEFCSAVDGTAQAQTVATTILLRMKG